MWLIPIAYIGLGVILVVLRREQKNPLDVLFAIVFWPMHVTLVEDEVENDIDDRFARFHERLIAIRAQNELVQQMLTRHEAQALEARISALEAQGDRASAEAARMHMAEVQRARASHERLSQRVARLEELEKSIALQLELQRVLPSGHAADVAMLLTDAETELDDCR